MEQQIHLRTGELIPEPDGQPMGDLVAVVQAAQAGDRSAIGELFSRYERMVYATALQILHQHTDAQDVSQDVFLKATKNLGQLREPLGFGGWLRKITVRTAINLRNRDRETIPLDDGAVCCESTDPVNVVLARERDSRVRVGLKQLGGTDRVMLEAHYFRWQSISDMSEHFQLPIGTVKRRLHVARQKLGKQMMFAIVCQRKAKRRKAVAAIRSVRGRGRPPLDATVVRDRESAILKLLVAGETALSIAAKIRVNRNTVSKVKKKHFVNTRFYLSQRIRYHGRKIKAGAASDHCLPGTTDG